MLATRKPLFRFKEAYYITVTGLRYVIIGLALSVATAYTFDFLDTMLQIQHHSVYFLTLGALCSSNKTLFTTGFHGLHPKLRACLKFSAKNDRITMTTAAHHSIHYQLLEPAHLTLGKRQRQLKGILLVVHQGAGLLQLGRHYYVLGQHDAVFLPADTLFAWHSLAHSRISQLAFSPRLTQPTKAGLLTDSALILAGATRLANWTHTPDWQGAYGRLCRVLHDELQDLQPHPFGSPATQTVELKRLINANLVNFTLNEQQNAEFRRTFNMQPEHFQRQCALMLALRELAKSADLEKLVQSYGFSSVAQFEEDCRYWLGSSRD